MIPRARSGRGWTSFLSDLWKPAGLQTRFPQGLSLQTRFLRGPTGGTAAHPRAGPRGSAEANPSGLLNCGKTLPQVEKLAEKVHHVDAHTPKSRATEEHCNKEQLDRAAKMSASDGSGLAT